MKDKVFDQDHSYDDEPRVKPVEKYVNKRYESKDFFCGRCDTRIRYLQTRCELCKRLIDWESV